MRPCRFRPTAVSFFGDTWKDLEPFSYVQILDGEGGYTVVGRLMPAADSLTAGALPLGLAHGWRLTRAVAAGELVRWTDVAVDASNGAVRDGAKP